MGNPRIHDGNKEIPIDAAPSEAHNIAPPAVTEGDETIFISVASYRDGERCGETIRAAFENADNPDDVTIGLVEQNAPEDKFCLEAYCSSFGIQTIERKRIRDSFKIVTVDGALEKCPRSDQIRQVSFHHINAKGPMMARSMARKALGNEDFCLQVDSHSDLAEHWDTLLLEEWKKVNNEFGVISTVPPAKSNKHKLEPGGPNEHKVPRTCKVRFQENGFPDYASPADSYAFDITDPILSLGWSAAFSFSKCHLEETVPYDSFATGCKPVEQFSRYARMWTRGYDTYTPTKNIVFHDYLANPDTTIKKDDWNKPRLNIFRKTALGRLKRLFGMQEGEDKVRANMGIYGFGKRRTLEQFQSFVNVDLVERQGNIGENAVCANLEYVPYDAGISPVDNLYDEPDDLEPQPEYPLRTQMTYPEVSAHLSYVDPDFIADGDATLDALDGNEDPNPEVNSTSWNVPILWMMGLVLWSFVFGAVKSTSKRKKIRAAKNA